MSRHIEIDALLRRALQPQSLVVTDDSSKHAGHAGARPEGQTHYTVEITAPAFAGKSRVERHRMVYAALGDQFAQGLHALAVKAKAPGES